MWLRLAITASCLALLSAPSRALNDPTRELAHLTGSDIGFFDQFGGAVAIDGDTLFVGAAASHGTADSSGSAFLFERAFGGDGWVQTRRLIPADLAQDDLFASAVSISGDTAVAGTPSHDSIAFQSGAVYVFERNQSGPGSWGQVAKLTASDAQTFDLLGVSVAIDGDTLAVGSYSSQLGADAGAVYVFERNAGGPGVWAEVKKIVASDGQAGDWACIVALDGDTLAVGAPAKGYNGPFSGSAYLYGRDHGGAGNWGEIKKLLPSDGAADANFGRTLSISGDTLVVGAPYDNAVGTRSGSAYVFRYGQGGAGNWGQVTKLTARDGLAQDEFGISVAISGEALIVGAHHNDELGSEVGAAYLFRRNLGGANNWGLERKLLPSAPPWYDRYGDAVALDDDTSVVGVPADSNVAPAAGAVYVYDHWASRSFCSAGANSVGVGAAISTAGSTSLAANDLRLQIEGAPSGQPGVFFMGGDGQDVPFGNGHMCIQAPVQRILPRTTTLPSGTVDFLVDYTTLSDPPQAGDARNVQFWYRDPAGGGFNTSDAVRISFCR